MSRWDEVDDAQQKRVRDLVIGPGLYGPYSKEGRYVYIDKGRLATKLQKQFAIDTITQGSKGDAVCIEEKIVRWPGYFYSAITLETKSCTVPGRESDGWMVYGQADLLNYAMCQEDGNVLVHLIDFQKLRAAFWPAHKQFKTTITEQNNHTECRIVPMRWIKGVGVGVFEKMIHADEDGAEAVRTFNGTHYRRPVQWTSPSQPGLL